jgi:hypothetical protein
MAPLVIAVLLRTQRLVFASSSMIVVVGATALLAPGKAYAACANNNMPAEKQHGLNVAVMCPGFNEISGQYTSKTELRIQSSHVVDRQHPYVNPEANHEHHHSSVPDRFIFVQYFDIVTSGNESALLAGLPVGEIGNPYNSIYESRFRVEGNAEFANISDWSGSLKIPKAGGGLTGFNFNIDVLGTGVGFGLSWENAEQPDKMTMTWTGDADNPKFTFSYAPGFTLDDNSVLQVNGFVKTKRPDDEFGRVIANGYATVLEDVALWENQKTIGFLKPSVYDVVHEVPGPLPVFGGAAALGFSRKLRKRIKLHRGTSAASTSPDT